MESGLFGRDQDCGRRFFSSGCHFLDIWTNRSSRRTWPSEMKMEIGKRGEVAGGLIIEARQVKAGRVLVCDEGFAELSRPESQPMAQFKPKHCLSFPLSLFGGW
jgi:hypothetical protein